MARAILIVAAIGTLLAAAPAQAAVVSGSGADPADPALAGGRDLTAVAASYDDAGTVSATVTLREPPSAAADGFVDVFVGTSTASGDCSALLGLGAFLDPASAQAVWLDAEGDSGTATKSAEGAALTLNASAPALAGRAVSCATAIVTQRDDADVVFDRLDVPIALGAPAPPPPPPAPSLPAAPAPEPVPAAAPAALLVVKAPALAPVKRGRRLRARIRVENNGTASARGVRLRVSAPKAMRVSPRTVRVGTLAPGGKRMVVLRLRARRNAKLALAVTARGAVPRAKGTLTVRIKRRCGRRCARRKPPARATPPLAGRYFTHVDVSTMTANAWTALAFVDGRWAYRGIPEGGLPTCTQRTAGVDADGDPTDGCVPYEYDPKAGTLRIDGEPATIDTARTAITLGEDEYSLAPLVRAGTRFDAELKSVSVFGFWPNQSITEKWMTMSADGQFALTSQSFGSFGLPGSPSVTWASVPPDQKGTYRFGPKGDLHLDYADGHSVVRMTGILRDAKTGSADPAKDGFLFGDEQFWLDDE
jgi:hypothetical protein